MKLPDQRDTPGLIAIANDKNAMRLLHDFPRKTVKILCQALKTEREMRLARDRRIERLLKELTRQQDLYRTALKGQQYDK